MTAVLDLITGPLGAVLGGVAAILAVILARWQGRSQGRREGRKEAETDALRDTQDRVERGRKAVRDGRGDSPADRLRRNDGRY